MTEGVTYSVRMDLDGFRDLFRAQQLRYMRKLFVGCAVSFGLLGAALLVSGLAALRPDALPYALLLIAAAVACAIAARRPPVALATRQGPVRRWFSQHGARDAAIPELGSLVASYDVSLEELGFCERSASAVLHTPWFALDARPVVGDRGAYFVLAKGKEASVAYNLIGINWAFRDEDVSGVLFLPNEVIEKNLGLVEGVRSSIRDARARYLGKGAQAAADGRVAAWMRGEPASPESAGA